MKIIKIILISIALTAQMLGQDTSFESIDLKISDFVEGTLMQPADGSEVPLLILVQGSGPTDRNGNQTNLENNSFKMIAEGLAEAGIATFRYDKRFVPMFRDGVFKEEELSFDDFVFDAKAVLTHFKAEGKFSGIFIAGHSQGSLVSMLAAQDGVDGYISISGPGQPIDNVIVDQLSAQLPAMGDAARKGFDELRAHGKVEEVPPSLISLLRPSMQPFMSSWIKYDPKVEIGELTCKVLIINGDNDLQIAESEAALLKEGSPNASYEIIPGMNHVLKTVEDNPISNYQAYNDPVKPLSPELLPLLIDFIKK